MIVVVFLIHTRLTTSSSVRVECVSYRRRRRRRRRRASSCCSAPASCTSSDVWPNCATDSRPTSYDPSERARSNERRSERVRECVSLTFAFVLLQQHSTATPRRASTRTHLVLLQHSIDHLAYYACVHCNSRSTCRRQSCRCARRSTTRRARLSIMIFDD
jgi:hypothetical protein